MNIVKTTPIESNLNYTAQARINSDTCRFADLVKYGKIYTKVSDTKCDVLAFEIIDVHLKKIITNISTPRYLYTVALKLDDRFHVMFDLERLADADGVKAFTPTINSMIYFPLNDNGPARALSRCRPMVYPAPLFKERFYLEGTKRPAVTTTRAYGRYVND